MAVCDSYDYYLFMGWGFLDRIQSNITTLDINYARHEYVKHTDLKAIYIFLKALSVSQEGTLMYKR